MHRSDPGTDYARTAVSTSAPEMRRSDQGTGFPNSSWYRNLAQIKVGLCQHSSQYLSPQLLMILPGPIFDEIQSSSLTLTVI